MAGLTWKNVTANTGAGSAALQEAGSLFSKAFDSATTAIKSRDKRLTARDTEEQLNKLRQITSVADYEQGIADIDAQAVGEYTDLAAVNKARAALLPALQKREQAETARQLAISDADYARKRARTEDYREDKARADAITNEQVQNELIQLQRGEEGRNEAALRDVAQTYQGPQQPGQAPLLDVDPTGQAQIDPNATVSARTILKDQIAQAGGAEPKTISELENEYLNDPRIVGLRKKEKDEGLKAIRANYDRQFLSPQEQATLNTKIASINAGRDADVALATETYRLDKEGLSYEGPLTEKEKRKELSDLNARMLKLYDDESMFTDAAGHTELTDLIGELMTKYEKQGIEPSMIEQFIGSSTLGDSGFFDPDLAVSIPDLKRKVKTYMESGAINAGLAKQKALAARHFETIAKIRGKAGQDATRATELANRAKGRPDPLRNIRAFNPTIPVSQQEQALRNAARNR